MTSDFRIVERPASLVVGLKVEASWDALWTEMPKAWRTLFARADELADRLDDVFVDVSLAQQDGRYTQLVGAEVRTAKQIPDGMVAVSIPAQRYVAARHVGPLQGIAESFGALYAWAERHGHPVDAFKLDVGYRPDGRETEHMLFVRLAG